MIDIGPKFYLAPSLPLVMTHGGESRDLNDIGFTEFRAGIRTIQVNKLVTIS